jgi:hypothetical protein
MMRAGTYPSLQDWQVALEATARALVEQRIRPGLRDSCLVCAEPCPQHGPGCAQVTYGMLRSHFGWTEEDPLRLAERLIATMLPHSK